jgi:hypothetical protein
VTLLEEMPVQETTDAVHELQRLDLPVGTVIVNAAQPPLLAKGKVSGAEIKRGLVAAGLPAEKDGRLRAGRRGQAAPAPARAGDLPAGRAGRVGRPVVELPLLSEGVHTEGLYRLAGALLDLGSPA